VTTWPPLGSGSLPTSDAFTAPDGAAFAPAASLTGGQIAAQPPTQVTFLALSGANVYSVRPGR